MENLNFSNEKNKIFRHPEYLKNDIKPIMASLESVSEEFLSYKESPNVKHVNLYADEKLMKENGYIKEGNESYIISPISNSDLFSDEFLDCTGVVAVGTDTNFDQNIAFMSHQNPYHFLKDSKDIFIKDFQNRLEEIKVKCKEKTIDAAIFGGRFAKVRQYDDSEPGRNIFIQEYIDSIKLLSEEVYKVLGFYPEVIVAPKLSPATESVRFDTQNRRLHLLREDREQKDFIENFNAKDIDIVSKKWKPGEWGLPI